MTQMTNIYQRLYLQTPDTQFDSFDDMYSATFREEQASQTRWIFPHGDRPLQIYTVGSTIRSIHPISYERLPNSIALEVVVDEATHMTEYRDQTIKIPAFFMGERDMFAYLIDESSWLVYREERFAPAFVIWNSEVGARSCLAGVAYVAISLRKFIAIEERVRTLPKSLICDPPLFEIFRQYAEALRRVTQIPDPVFRSAALQQLDSMGNLSRT